MYILRALPEFETWLSSLSDQMVRDVVIKKAYSG